MTDKADIIDDSIIDVIAAEIKAEDTSEAVTLDINTSKTYSVTMQEDINDIHGQEIAGEDTQREIDTRALMTIDKAAEGQDGGGRSSMTIHELKKRKRQKEFLRSYLDHWGYVLPAAKAIGLTDWTHYHWLRTDKHYQGMYQKAYEVLAGRIEGSFLQGALVGDDRELTYKGQRTGDSIKEIDKIARICAVKKFVPEYRDNPAFMMGVNAGGPMEITFGEPAREANRLKDS